MDRDRHSFATFAKVKIGAFVMHTLVSYTVDASVTSIANRHMHCTHEHIGTQVISGVGNLDECMMRVLLLGNSIAQAAGVEIRTINAFITVTSNARVTEVASRTVNSRSNGWRGNLRRGYRRRSTSDTRNDDAAWFSNLPELVEGVMLLSTARSDAFSAQVVIRAIQALVPNSFNLLRATITQDIVMDGGRCSRR